LQVDLQFGTLVTLNLNIWN